MKSLCIVADTHRKHRELLIPECDLLIHCGDFCSFRREEERTLADADIWFAEAPAKHVVCIGGNHDFLLQSREFRFAHATFLEDRTVEIGGLLIHGSPWCPDLSGFAYYATNEQLIEKWRMIPSGIDVLITHTPPFGILDIPSSGGIHLGCPHLRAELNRIRPKLHVFGHVHASHGTHFENGTRFVNAAVVGGRDLEVCHAPTMVDQTPEAEGDDSANGGQGSSLDSGFASRCGWTIR
jgi:Icc-related predicted phosphoesterase